MKNVVLPVLVFPTMPSLIGILKSAERHLARSRLKGFRRGLPCWTRSMDIARDKPSARRPHFDLSPNPCIRRYLGKSQPTWDAVTSYRELRSSGLRSIGSSTSARDPWLFKTEVVPWSSVRDWSCIACGECCRHFSVPITQREWRTIVQLHGLGFTTVIKGRPHLRSAISGRCIFQRFIQGRWLCTIQSVKPLVCKLWPFRICSRPSHGDPDSASFTYRQRQVFVYCDPRCTGVHRGPPSPHLVNKVLPELAATALGEGIKQRFSTAQIGPSALVRVFVIEPPTSRGTGPRGRRADSRVNSGSKVRR